MKVYFRMSENLFGEHRYVDVISVHTTRPAWESPWFRTSRGIWAYQDENEYIVGPDVWPDEQSREFILEFDLHRKTRKNR